MSEPQDARSVAALQEQHGTEPDTVVDATVGQLTADSKSADELEGVEHQSEQVVSDSALHEDPRIQGPAVSDNDQSGKAAHLEEPGIPAPAEREHVESVIPEEMLSAEAHIISRQDITVVTDQITPTGHSGAPEEVPATNGHPELDSIITVQTRVGLDAQQSSTNDEAPVDSQTSQAEQYEQGQVDPVSHAPDTSDVQMPDMTTVTPFFDRYHYSDSTTYGARCGFYRRSIR